VLHGECAGHPKDGGNPPDRVDDVKAEEEFRFNGASTTQVASSGPHRSATHPTGRRERES
jgi:hypothetical protein